MVSVMEAQDFFGKGQALYEEGKLDEAVTAFEKALEQEPDRIEIYAKLAQVLLETGRTGEAIRVLQDGIARDPGNAILYAKLAVAFFLAQNLEKATETYHELRTLDPEMAREIGKMIIHEPSAKPIFRLNTKMHTGSINDLDMDGDPFPQLVVTASDDKTVRIWSIEDGLLLRVLRPPIGEGPEGEVTTVAISPDGKTVACGVVAGVWEDKEVVFLFDQESGTLRGILSGFPTTPTRVRYSSDGRYLAVLLSQGGGLCIFDTGDYSLLARDPDYGEDDALGLDWYEGRLITASFDHFLRLYEVDERGLTLLKKIQIPGENRPHSVAFSPDGRNVAVGFFDAPRVEVYSIPDLALSFTPDCSRIKNGNLPLVTWSREGDFLYAGGRFHQNEVVPLVRWSLQNPEDVIAVPVAGNTLMALRAIPVAGEGLLYASTEPSWGRLLPQGTQVFHHPSPLFDFRGIVEHFLVSSDGHVIEILPYRTKEPLRFSLTERKFVRAEKLYTTLHPPRIEAPGLAITGWWNEYRPEVNGKTLPLHPGERSRALVISPDETLFVLGTEWYLYCFDTRGNRRWYLRAPAPCWGVNISPDGEKVIAAYGDGTIHLYRLSDGQELLGLFLTRDSWVMWTPSGYFDASDGGEELSGWHCNQGKDREAEFYPLSHFFEEFYRPLLLREILEKNRTDREVLQGAKPLVDIATLKKPPLVRILSPKDGVFLSENTVSLTFEVTDQGGGISEILLYQNGKLVYREKESFSSRTVNRTVSLHLVPERNEFRLKALNEESTESHPATCTVHAPKAIKPARLFLVAIGVNDYIDPEVKDLPSSQSDAETIVEVFKAQEGILFREVIPILLTDQDATRANVERTMEWVIENAQEDDALIFFWSGHGGTIEAQNRSLFYLFPHEALLKPRNEEELEQDTITMNLLAHFLFRLKARKQSLVLNTCHSGAAVDFLKEQLSHEESVRTLSRTLGVALFAASSASEKSWATKLLGVSLFTFSFLYALDGGKSLTSTQKALGELYGFTEIENADSDHDGMVFTQELGAFLKAKLPPLAEQAVGESQIPQVFIQGLDFPLYAHRIPSQKEDSRFTFRPPEGIVFQKTIEYGTRYITPNHGELYLMEYPPQVDIETQVARITAQATFRFEVGVGKARVRVYLLQEGKTYALLVATYPESTVLLLIILPAEEYEKAKSWIVSAIQGVQIKE